LIRVFSVNVLNEPDAEADSTLTILFYIFVLCR
jgi:hypothetical protein